jgi:enhancing lycopene biosynthesis protein 2
MKKVAVVLSGCGVYDGSEIYEGTCTLLYLDQNDAEITCFAPKKKQYHVIDHTEGKPIEGESRDVYTESARLARGQIKPITELKVDDFDAVVFPGGFGAAKNLCTFAFDGSDCDIDSEVARVISETVDKKKVLGAICIAPAVVARALKDSGKNPKLTVGTDQATMDALKAMNAEPEAKQVTEITVDETNRIVSTPAYMLGQRISEVAAGIEKLVKKVLEMA